MPASPTLPSIQLSHFLFLIIDINKQLMLSKRYKRKERRQKNETTPCSCCCKWVSGEGGTKSQKPRRPRPKRNSVNKQFQLLGLLQIFTKMSSFSVLLWFGFVAFVGVAMAADDTDTDTSTTTSTSASRELSQTPTWAVAGVCTVIIVVSLILEKVLHTVGKFLQDRHKRGLFDALEKVKAELMILGFISLILTFGQKYIAKICIPLKVANTMLPCSVSSTSTAKKLSISHQRLLADRRILAAVTTTSCNSGYEPLISIDGLHQLHILIFFLAAFHVTYSAITMLLGRLKIRGWKAWEAETSSHSYEFSNDASRFRLTHETSFVKAHTSYWTRIPFFFYVGCFFRQFFRSVSKSDYLTLRNGFISVHLAPGSRFNFQKYIKRSLEDDFQVVVGVSPVLWASFVLFLLLNVKGWHALFWASLIPVIIILAIGTELQSVLTKMALEISERHAVVQGIPLVQGSDRYFWFGRPHLVLHLIHFALFQNAFQIIYFLWIWYSFGLQSCFHANFKLAIAKVILGGAVLCMCSYITLPLYALVTQMGSNMKKSIFDEQTSKALKKWHNAVKKKTGGQGGKSTARTLGGSTIGGSSSGSALHSSGPTLHRFKTTGHSTRSSVFEDHETSDRETDPLSPPASTNLIVRVDEAEQITEIAEPQNEEQTTIELNEFSFTKPDLGKQT